MDSLLRIAIRMKNINLVQMHVNKGTDCLNPDSQGRTAAMLAADAGDASIFRLIMSVNTDFSKVDQNGKKLLDHVLDSDNKEISDIYYQYATDDSCDSFFSDTTAFLSGFEWNSDDTNQSITQEEKQDFRLKALEYEQVISNVSVKQPVLNSDNNLFDWSFIERCFEKPIVADIQLSSDCRIELQRLIVFSSDFQTIPVELIIFVLENNSLTRDNFVRITREYLEAIDITVTDDEGIEIKQSVFSNYRSYESFDEELFFEESQELWDLLSQDNNCESEQSQLQNDFLLVKTVSVANAVNSAKKLFRDIHRHLAGKPALFNSALQFVCQKYEQYLKQKSNNDYGKNVISGILKNLFDDKEFQKTVQFYPLLLNGRMSEVSISEDDVINELCNSLELTAVIIAGIFHLQKNRNEDSNIQPDISNATLLKHFLGQLQACKTQIFNSCINSTVRYVLKENLHTQYSDSCDNIQNGLFGLVRGVNRYNFLSKCQLLSYSSYWVWQSIHRGLTDSLIISVPDYILVKKLESVPISDELSEDSINDRKYGDKLKRFCCLFNNRFQSIPENERSVQESFAETNGLFVDENPCSTIESAELKGYISLMIRLLPPRLLDIIIKRYGLHDKPDQTLDYIADEMHVTRERIRQLEKRGMELLRQQIKILGEIAIYDSEL